MADAEEKQPQTLGTNKTLALRCVPIGVFFFFVSKFPLEASRACASSFSTSCEHHGHGESADLIVVATLL